MHSKPKKKSIFRALFVPMIFIMIFQALIFYFSAIYGGIEESLSQNAADIFSGTLNSRKSEIETRFNNRWADLDDCIEIINEQYASFEEQYGASPFTRSTELEVVFLEQAADTLISTLRHTETNGIFLILNDMPASLTASPTDGEQKYGLCIRDMDQDNNYSGREDLLIERSPSSLIDTLQCSLDSWWEAKYTFSSVEESDYYYKPLAAAKKFPHANSLDLAYISSAHRISRADPEVISLSVPLLASDGEPYAVLGVEIAVNYIASLLPNTELGDKDEYSYIFTMHDAQTDTYEPISGTGSLYNRNFDDDNPIIKGAPTKTGGFSVIGKTEEPLYLSESTFDIYNSNNPFEARQPVLLAVAEEASLFSYISLVKSTLMAVSLISLLLGIIGLAFVSRRFASPITALSKRVRSMDENDVPDKLDRLGIAEIDQLVDAIDELNRNVSRNSARSEFFSRMSHDMRTPMNAIISFSSQELLDGTDAEVKNEYLDKIHTSALYLLGLINDVLDMTKIESNQTGLHPASVLAQALFDTPVHIVSELAEKKELTFSSQISIPPDLRIIVDEQHLNQIVMNLLSNAVKFTPEGGKVAFGVNIIGESPNENFKIVVADSGIGMSEEFMKKLYTPFERESNNREGTGLGLSIAKKLVELMEGEIVCESTLGEGTSFTITIPIVRDTAVTEPLQPKSEETIDIALLNGKRVLVCEDNEINIDIIVLLLKRVGIKADVALNGEQGLQLFEASDAGYYDAILMDIRMPIMDGLVATRAIRGLERQDAAKIPIIAMTADAFSEDEASSLSAGMNAHLSKPIEPKKFYAALLKYT